MSLIIVLGTPTDPVLPPRLYGRGGRSECSHALRTGTLIHMLQRPLLPTLGRCCFSFFVFDTRWTRAVRIERTFCMEWSRVVSFLFSIAFITRKKTDQPSDRRWPSFPCTEQAQEAEGSIVQQKRGSTTVALSREHPPAARETNLDSASGLICHPCQLPLTSNFTGSSTFSS